jgi:hypothetical protein
MQVKKTRYLARLRLILRHILACPYQHAIAAATWFAANPAASSCIDNWSNATLAAVAPRATANVRVLPLP